MLKLSWMPSAFERFSSGYHNSLDFMHNRSLNHCKETRMEIFIMTSESCAMMFFAGKNPCQCVSHYFRCRGHFLLHRTARGTAARVVRTQIFLSVWEHDYLQYSWIVFLHCSTVTAVSRVSVDKFLVSLVSNYHVS